MLSIGIIWNSANFLKEDILKDISEQTNILGYFEMDLGTKYNEFVKAIYDSEEMEKWKIENKINHMILTPTRKITVLFFEFDQKEIAYHPIKKKKIYIRLEKCKIYIREKYKKNIPNYTYDIIFHATDNLIELKNLKYKIFVSYIATRYTDYDIEKIKRNFSNWCDEVAIVNVRNQSGLMPEITNLLSCYNNDNKIPAERLVPCHYVFDTINVSCEGYLTACCTDFENYLAYANINNTSLKDAWHN